jgi:hypothetical protein
VAAPARNHPGLQIGLTSPTHPEALELVRTGKIDAGKIDSVICDDRLYLLPTRRGYTLAPLRDATWIAGCDRRARDPVCPRATVSDRSVAGRPFAVHSEE